MTISLTRETTAGLLYTFPDRYNNNLTIIENSIISGGGGDVTTTLLASISANLQDQIFNVESTIYNVSGSLQNQIDSNISLINGLISISGDHETRITNNETSLSGIISITGNHETRITNNELSIIGLVSISGDHETRIDTNELSIIGLVSISGDHETRIDTNELSIIGLVSISGDHETRINTNELSIVGLVSISGDHETRITNNETSINELISITGGFQQTLTAGSAIFFNNNEINVAYDSSTLSIDTTASFIYVDGNATLVSCASGSGIVGNSIISGGLGNTYPVNILDASNTYTGWLQNSYFETEFTIDQKTANFHSFIYLWRNNSYTCPYDGYNDGVADRIQIFWHATYNGGVLLYYHYNQTSGGDSIGYIPWNAGVRVKIRITEEGILYIFHDNSLVYSRAIDSASDHAVMFYGGDPGTLVNVSNFTYYLKRTNNLKVKNKSIGELQLQDSILTSISAAAGSENQIQVNVSGRIGAYSTLTYGTSDGLLTQASTSVNNALVVKGAASQTANLQEWQNSSGTKLSYIDNTGNLSLAYSLSGNNDKLVKLNSSGTLQASSYTDSTISGLVSISGDHETRITNNETSISGLVSISGDHETRITNNETSISGLVSISGDHETRITNNETSITGLVSISGDHETRITNNETSISGLVSISGNHETRITNNETSISGLVAISGDHENRIDSNELSIIGLVSISGDHETRITNNETSITIISGSYIDSTQTKILALSAYGEVTNELKGFPNRTDSSISFNESTRLFTISGSSFDIYLKGVKYTHISDSLTISNTYGNHFIFYNLSNELVVSLSFFDLAVSAPVSIITWNPNISAGFLQEERHGLVMDWATHERLHDIDGSKYGSGGNIANYTLATNGDVNSQFTISSLDFFDEDIAITQTASISGNYTLFYRATSGADWRWTTGNTLPFKDNGTNPTYNEYTGGAWQQTEISLNNRYINYYLLVTSAVSSDFKFILVQGQTLYSSLITAQGESITSLALDGLELKEYVVLYQITFRRVNGAGTRNCRLEAIKKIVGQNAITISSAVVVTHNSLSGRTDANSHPATAISTDITNFNGALSESDSDVQLCLDTLDNKVGELISISGNHETRITNLETYTSGVTGGLTQLDNRYVNVIGDTMTGALSIVGSSDVTQFLIKANAAQTNLGSPLMALQDSSGSELMRITTNSITNTFIGQQAGYKNNATGGGTSNTFIGGYSGRNVSTGASNVALGYYSLATCTTGSRNMAIGAGALQSLTTSVDNVAIGNNSGNLITTGTDNFAIGSLTLQGTTSGSSNIAIGSSALRASFYGSSSNIAIGKGNLQSTQGSNNVAIGTGVGRYLGSGNTIIGYLAAGSPTTDISGSNNIFIGNLSGYYESGSNKLFIDISGTTTPLIYGEFDNRIIKINGSLYIPSDTNVLYLGAGNDVSIGYDGSNTNIRSDLITPSDLNVDCGTNKTIVLEIPVYNEISVSLLTARPLLNTPALTILKGNIYQYTFDNSSDELFSSINIPHNYKQGTNIDVNLHWATNGLEVSDKTVKWEFEYTFANALSAFSDTITLDKEITIVSNTPDRTHYMTLLGAITGSTLLIDSNISWKFKRIASSGTEPASDPFGLSLSFNYQTDTIGSRQAYSK